jgi:hypothetical protein
VKNQDVDRVSPLVRQGKILYPEHTADSQKKNTLSVFYLSDAIHKAEDRLQAGAGYPE